MTRTKELIKISFLLPLKPRSLAIKLTQSGIAACNVKVKLEVDVKAGNNPKVIASDEAKAMGACHVILDK